MLLRLQRRRLQIIDPGRDRGEPVNPAAIAHPEEIVRLNDAVSRLSQAFRAALERDRARQ